MCVKSLDFLRKCCPSLCTVPIDVIFLEEILVEASGTLSLKQLINNSLLRLHIGILVQNTVGAF